MDVGGIGGSPYMMPGMQGMQSARQTQASQAPMAAGGVNARQIADNSMAQRTLPMDASGVAARAMTEAKGMFVDTYA